MAEAIPHSRPLLGQAEEAAILAVVRSGIIAQGPQVEALEGDLAARLSAPRACAVSHGTGALHLALLAVGAAPGRSVLLPSYSCSSLLNAVLYTGAEPVLVDSLADVPDMDLDQAQGLMDQSTCAVVVPHLFGRAVPVHPVPWTVPLIEDGTQSVGAAGVGVAGTACVYSFYATKMLAGGEGGAITTRSDSLDAFVRDRRSYDQRPDWALRFNYKMTDLSAALLRVQLGRLDSFLAARRRLADFYRAELRDQPGLEMPPTQSGEAHFRFVVRLEERRRDQLELQLRAQGVLATRPVWSTLHQCLNLPERSFPHAQRHWGESLSLPLYPALTDPEAERVVAAVRKALQAR